MPSPFMHKSNTPEIVCNAVKQTASPNNKQDRTKEKEVEGGKKNKISDTNGSNGKRVVAIV